MPRRRIRLTAGHYFHLYNRGHNRQHIFFEEENYDYFLGRFHHYLVAGGQCEVLAYCLMPTHYHLLVKVQGSWFTRAMQRFLLSYTKAINKRYGRSGTLFGGRYQAKRVNDAAQLNELLAYILANPVKAGLAETAAAWPHAGSDWPALVARLQQHDQQEQEMSAS
jgi:REP element-mobilizing transposase RayT